jgi:hypothetical protein
MWFVYVCWCTRSKNSQRETEKRPALSFLLTYLLDLLVKQSRNFSQLATVNASRIPHISPSDKHPFVLSPFDQGFQLEFYTPTSHRQKNRHGTYTVHIEKKHRIEEAHSELHTVCTMHMHKNLELVQM